MVAPPTRRPRNGPPIKSFSMSVEWAGLGPELLVRLDRDGGEPLTAQLERALRDAIQTGRLGPGERVPSSRALARELGVSRGLVQECYAQLHAEGFLSTRTGSGTRVAAGAPPRAAPGTPTQGPGQRTRDRLSRRPARPGQLPPPGLGLGHARSEPYGAGPGAELRRPPRRPHAARGARRLSAARPWSGHRP